MTDLEAIKKAEGQVSRSFLLIHAIDGKLSLCKLHLTDIIKPGIHPAALRSTFISCSNMSAQLDPSSDVFIPMNLEDTHTDDLEFLRVSCKASGSVSNKSFFERVFVFNHAGSFDRLNDIYQHPSLCRSLSTIVYCPSHFIGTVEHGVWLQNQEVIARNTALRLGYDGIYTDQPTQILRYYDELRESHDACVFEADMLLAHARSACPTLNHIVLDCAVYTTESVQNRRAAFNNVLLTSKSSDHWQHPSDRDDTLRKVIESLGRHRRSRPLDSLTMVNVAVRTGLDTTVFEHLKHVRVIDWTYHLSATETSRIAKTSGLALAYHAKSLESLQIRNSMPVEAEVPNLLAQRFVKLRYCRLSGLRVDSAGLSAFLKGHGETLEYLALGYIQLKSGTWGGIALGLAGHMKALKKLRVDLLVQADGTGNYVGHLQQDWTTKMMETIVSIDGTEGHLRQAHGTLKHDAVFMAEYPAIGPQDEYNAVCYDDYGDVTLW